MDKTVDDCWTEDDYNDVLGFVERNLWLNVRENSATHKPKQVICNLMQLSYQELKLLQRIYFLLSNTINKCIFKSIPRLFRHLTPSTSLVATDSYGSIRGHIDWNLTLKRRMISGFSNPTIFMTHAPIKTYDIPEMQALKFLITQVNRLCMEVLEFSPGELQIQSYDANDKKWKNDINKMYNLTSTFLKNSYMRTVSIPNKVTDQILQRVRCSRCNEFKSVYDGLRLYRNLFIREDQEALKTCIEQGVLKPLNRDTLYEIYILLLTIMSLEKNGWKQDYIRLIGYGKGAIAQYKYVNVSVKIYYQTLPSSFIINSVYKDLMEKYSINASLRRPDMVLEFDFYNHDFKLIEIKRTQDKRYIVDSVYKVLGYLKDFEDCFKSGRLPYAILVIWDDVGGEENVNDIMVIRGRHTFKQYIESDALR